VSEQAAANFELSEDQLFTRALTMKCNSSEQSTLSQRQEATQHNDDARAEALIGLVQRRDPCSYDEVIRALTDESVGRLSVQAAAILGDERLAEPLHDLTSWWDVDSKDLEWALYRCAPGRSRREVASMKELDRHFELITPGWSLVFESTLADGEISIRAQNAHQEVGTWSFQHLMVASSNNDPEIAANRIRSMIQMRHSTL
jgi:hypothetical protein